MPEAWLNKSGRERHRYTIIVVCRFPEEEFYFLMKGSDTSTTSSIRLDTQGCSLIRKGEF